MGVGASAGGLKAIQEFLRALPASTRLAFVFFQHLVPNVESHLPEILARASPLPVSAPRNGERLAAGRVYVVAPTFLPLVSKGRFVLRPHSGTGAAQYPIDRLFSSLAKDYDGKAVGVVLSGTGSDGTAGCLEIKAEGGVTFAQDGATADQHAMPANAAAAGGVDFMLRPREMARRIARMGDHPYLRRGPRRTVAPDVDASEFAKVLGLLRSRTSIDFTKYRDKTLKRRVLRRMVLRNCENLAAYARMLAVEPAEVDALFQDVLISVTGFFRDPGVFKAIRKEILPALARRHVSPNTIRAWVAGCSTGEEAYSMAMELLEYFGRAAKPVQIQVFATDINESHLQKARVGWYPSSIEANVSPERLRRFFVREDGGYRIVKSVRELCVFARQNLTSDPPFSRMDLITCRNVLIYLDPHTQRRVFPSFHYALGPHGFLVLGAAESVHGSQDLFATIDGAHRIYQRRPHSPRVSPAVFSEHLPRMPRIPTVLTGPGQSLQAAADHSLVARFAPPSAVTDDKGGILQLRGHTAAFLQKKGGPSRNVFALARKDVRPSLEAAFNLARKTGEAAERQLVTRGKRGLPLTIGVTPLRPVGKDRASFLITFEEGSGNGDPRFSDGAGGARATSRSGRLETQLRSARSSLQSVVEQQEATNEELRSANEEMVTSHEELQSTNEELETAKEELQSSNEELSTVNEELHRRNLQLDRTNNDLANLLTSVKIPIVMLAPDRTIRHFTESAAGLANLIPTDVGRPLGHLRTNLDVEDLDAIASKVMETLEPVEREVRDKDGRWYSLRMRPYRTKDNRIDGAVLAMVDIDAIKRAEEELKASADLARAVVDTFPDPVIIVDRDVRVRTANAAFFRYFHVDAINTEGRFMHDLGSGQWDIPGLAERLKGGLPSDASVVTMEASVALPDVGRRIISITASRVAGRPELTLLALQDVTETRETTVRLQDANAALLDVDHRKSELIEMIAHDVRTPLTSMVASLEMVKIAGNPRILPSIDILDRNLQRLGRLADELLNVVRLESPRVTLKHDRIDFVKIGRRAMDALRERAERLDVNLSLHGDGHLVVLGPKDHLMHTVLNLVDNAIRATPRGGEVRVRVFRMNHDAVLEVEDTGVGFDEEDRAALFRPFESRPMNKGGAGLSLYVGASLAKLLGGGLDATSPGPGKGAVFRLWLPLTGRNPPPKAP